MRKFFAYSSKISYGLPANHDKVVDKMLLGLKKKLTLYSNEEADLVGNTVYFAVNLRSRFIGIDSGSVSVTIENNTLAVHYWLSYISPFLPFLALDISLKWMSTIKTINQTSSFVNEASTFSFLITMYLVLYIIGIIANIFSFPAIINEVWASI
ncbi:MAG: hypothetical protein U0V02_03135 [Anaerolineales bacterium]